jgi:phage gp36-like protein
MAPYSVTSDVRFVLSPGAENTDDTTAAGMPDESFLDAIQRAHGVVNSYLAGRYAVPVNADEYDKDGLLSDCESVIAAWYLTLTLSGSRPVEPNDPVRLRYEATIKMLEQIASGVLSPPWPTETDNAANDAVVVNRYGGEMFGFEDFDIGEAPRTPQGWGIAGAYGGW